MAIERKRTALELALAVVPHVREVLTVVRRADRHLADQLKRATSSVALNLAEAEGNRDGNRRLRLETARGSAKEAMCALRLAVAWGYVRARDVDDAIAAMDRLGMMTWRMMHGRRDAALPRSTTPSTAAAPRPRPDSPTAPRGRAVRDPDAGATATSTRERDAGPRVAVLGARSADARTGAQVRPDRPARLRATRPFDAL